MGKTFDVPAAQHDPQDGRDDCEKQDLLDQGTSLSAASGVGLWGAVVLCVNTMNGPGLLAIPEVYQSAGWLFPTLCLLLVALVAGSTGELVEAAMALAGSGIPPQSDQGRMPSSPTSPRSREVGSPRRHAPAAVRSGSPQQLVDAEAQEAMSPRTLRSATTAASPSRRSAFTRRSGLSTFLSTVSTRYEAIREAPDQTLEFVSLVGTYFGRTAEKVTTFMLTLCLLTLGLAQMVIGCQVVDSLIVFITGRSYAFRYAGGSPAVVHSSELSLTPFGTGFWGVSLGFLIVMPFCMALGRMDLSSNIGPQIASFLLLCFSLVTFFWHFASTEYNPLEPSRVPVVDSGGLAGFLGVVVFNYSFIISVPSLVNEKRPSVSMSRAVWTGTTFMTLVYAATGILGAMAFRVNHNNVMADLLYPAAPVVTKLAVFGFTLAIIPAVPIYGILLQYNMEQQKLLSGWRAYAVANGVPWITVMVLLYQPTFINAVNWVSLLVNGFVNFTIPLAVFVKASYVHSHQEWPQSTCRWLQWGCSTAWKNGQMAKAVAALLFMTGLLVFTILVNLVYVFALGQDLVSSSQPAVAGGGPVHLAPSA